MTRLPPVDDAGQLRLADRYYAAFNARDQDAWLDTLDEDVEIVIDGGVSRGRAAALAYPTGILQAYPGVMVSSRRVVASSGDAVVSEFHLANPTAVPGENAATPAEPGVPWRLDGTPARCCGCEVTG